MFTSVYVHMVNICRHALLDSSLFIRKMLVAAHAHYFHCQKASPLLYFEFAMDDISSRWKVQQQVKDLLKPGGKSSGKGKQEKCGHQQLQRMKMAVMPTTINIGGGTMQRMQFHLNMSEWVNEWVSELPCNYRCQQQFHSHSHLLLLLIHRSMDQKGTCA